MGFGVCGNTGDVYTNINAAPPPPYTPSTSINKNGPMSYASNVIPRSFVLKSSQSSLACFNDLDALLPTMQLKCSN